MTVMAMPPIRYAPSCHVSRPRRRRARCSPCHVPAPPCARPRRAEGRAEPRRRRAADRDRYPAAARGRRRHRGGYNQSRWAEDWTQLSAIPKKRDDFLDRLKFIPLDSDGDVYLTLSGEVRLRVNHTTNPNLRDAEAQRQDINRIVGGADLHVGPHFRAYGEIAHGGVCRRQNLGSVARHAAQRSGRAAVLRRRRRRGRRCRRRRRAMAARTFTDGPNLLVVAARQQYDLLHA